MELLARNLTPFRHMILEFIEEFRLVDVGCAGGLDPLWLAMGRKLRALAFDSNTAEVERLTASNTNIGVEYHAAAVEGDGWGTPSTRNPWRRSTVHTLGELLAERRAAAADEDKVRANDWQMMPRALRTIRLPDELKLRGFESFDFLKIDVDGLDYGILRSMKPFSDAGIGVGVCVEVNWHGSSDPREHTFHNTDRFLRECGFELFDFTKRRYSMAALPQPFEFSLLGPSLAGRPYQGDAIYLRDIAALPADAAPSSERMQQALKVAFLLSAIGQPDSAAEVLLCMEPFFASDFPVINLVEHLYRESLLGERFSANSFMDALSVIRDNPDSLFPIPAEQLRNMRGMAHRMINEAEREGIRSVAIYGSRGLGTFLVEGAVQAGLAVRAVIDGDPSMVGRECVGTVVVGPEVIPTLDVDSFLVGSIARAREIEAAIRAYRRGPIRVISSLQ